MTGPNKKQKLTPKAIDNLEVPAHLGAKLFYDSKQRGFAVRVGTSGHRTYVATCTLHGKERRLTIGRCEDMKVKKARKLARKIKRWAEDGIDPKAELENRKVARAAREAERARRQGLTVDALCEMFLEEHALKNLREQTYDDYRIKLRTHIIGSSIGAVPAHLLGDEQVAALHGKIGVTAPVAANRAMSILRKVYRWADKKKKITEVLNPCRNLEWHPETISEDFLDTAQMRKLIATLDAFDDPLIPHIVRVCAMTGSRIGETLTARWSDINLDTCVWEKPPSSTKQRRKHQVALCPTLVRHLKDLRGPRDKPPVSEYVFPAQRRSDTPHRGRFDGQFQRLMAQAGLVDAEGMRLVTLHGLRHSVGSLLISLKHPDNTISEILGHARAGGKSVTARYRAMPIARKHEIMLEIDKALTGPEQPSNVVNFSAA